MFCCDGYFDSESGVSSIPWFVNHDLDNIVTPVDVDTFGKMLMEAGYNLAKTEYLVKGFKDGFNLNFVGDQKVRRMAPNLKIRIGSKEEIWAKIMKEVKAKRFAGPYENPPYEHFIQSPIRLVPKDGGTKTRLIFHLSYPKNADTSVNAQIPRDKCTVAYPSFEKAVQLCLKHGVKCHIGKMDMSMAFRNVSVRGQDWCLLILKAEHPVTHKVYFFVDKCLPFGSSISCAIFQDFSDAVAFLVTHHTKQPSQLFG